MRVVLLSCLGPFAAPRAGAHFAGKNRFIRLVILLLPAGGFANLLGLEKQK